MTAYLTLTKQGCHICHFVVVTNFTVFNRYSSWWNKVTTSKRSQRNYFQTSGCTNVHHCQRPQHLIDYSGTEILASLRVSYRSTNRMRVIDLTSVLNFTHIVVQDTVKEKVFCPEYSCNFNKFTEVLHWTRHSHLPQSFRTMAALAQCKSFSV